MEYNTSQKNHRQQNRWCTYWTVSIQKLGPHFFGFERKGRTESFPLKQYEWGDLKICLLKGSTPISIYITNNGITLTMVNVYNKSNSKTWKRTNEPLNLPPDCTDERSMQDHGENDKHNTIWHFRQEGNIVNNVTQRKGWTRNYQSSYVSWS